MEKTCIKCKWYTEEKRFCKWVSGYTKNDFSCKFWRSKDVDSKNNSTDSNNQYIKLDNIKRLYIRALKLELRNNQIVQERNIKSNDNSKFDFAQLINYNKLSNKQEEEMTTEMKKAVLLDLESNMKTKIESMMTKTSQGTDTSMEEFYIDMYWNQIKVLKQATAEQKFMNCQLK